MELDSHEFFGINQDLTWYLFVFYVECDMREREELWSESFVIKEICDGSWVVCGDFSVSRFPSATDYDCFLYLYK